MSSRQENRSAARKAAKAAARMPGKTQTRLLSRGEFAPPEMNDLCFLGLESCRGQLMLGFSGGHCSMPKTQDNMNMLRESRRFFRPEDRFKFPDNSQGTYWAYGIFNTSDAGIDVFNIGGEFVKVPNTDVVVYGRT